MPANQTPVGVQTLFPDEAKTFIQEHTEGSYVLLDVRQPAEYETSHLPGAQLIPLPLLANSLDQLDPSRPIIVYCAVGGRSQVAAQFLAHRGFENVFQMQGGIEAWEDPTASSPVSFHLRFLQGDETPEEVIALAYHMEEGLRQFHTLAGAKTGDPALADLMGILARMEEKHKEAVLALLPDPTARESLLARETMSSEEAVMEGGIEVRRFLQENEAFLQDTKGYLELAMMVETQALDLYLRMAGASSNETTRKALLRIGDEEKNHLAMLGKFVEEHWNRSSE